MGTVLPVAGKLIEKFKPSHIAITGSILLSAGYLLSGYCSTIHQLVNILKLFKNRIHIGCTSDQAELL